MITSAYKFSRAAFAASTSLIKLSLHLERYAGKQEDGHHQNTEQHWENQQTRKSWRTLAWS